MRRIRRAVAATLFVATLCIGAGVSDARGGAATTGAGAAEALSQHPLVMSSGWDRDDEAPSSAVVHPVRVLNISGGVQNAAALTGGPGTTTLTYPASLVLDYGKEVEGKAFFDVSAGAGSILQTTYTETLKNMGNDGALSVALFQSGNSSRNDTFVTAGKGVITASMIQGGQRYELVELKTPGTVSLSGAGFDFTAPRETPNLMRGHFYSSSVLLNRIWYAGAYTLNLNQMTPGTPVADEGVNQDYLILDGAKRDRAVWSGDHMVSDLTDYYVSDPVYAADSDALFLDHPATTAGEAIPAAGVMSEPGPLPGACSPNPTLADICVTWSASYSLAVIPAVYNYYLYTGDLGYVRDHWQAVLRQMDWDAQQVDHKGLFSISAADDADWNLESISGDLTFVNALYVMALKDAARLAAALGDQDNAAAWDASAAAVTAAVNQQLWNPTTGLYDASTTLRGAAVQDANVIAILAGIATPQRARVILPRLARDLATPYGPAAADARATGYVKDISPYMGSFNVFADFANGRTASALALISREWGYMVAHDPGGTVWERIETNGVPASGALADSTAHAWSTGPTSALSEYVLGAAPLTPGFASWTVTPQPGSLTWAQGVIPTPHGSLSVLWKRSRRTFQLTVAAPSGTSGVVTIPLLGSRTVPIASDGRLVWNGRRAIGRSGAYRSGAGVVFPAVTGTHTFAY